MTRHDLREYLRKEGFNEDKISHSMELLSKNRHLESKKTMNEVVYWTALVVMTASNFIIITFIMPFLLTIEGITPYILMAIVAAGFGFLFNLLIHDIEHIKTRHHLIAGLFIPGIALITVFVMASIGNFMVTFLEIHILLHSPWLVSLVYVVFFMLPYLGSRYWRYITKFESKIEKL